MIDDKDGHPDILQKNDLRGCKLALSVSESADLSRLGFLETHFRLAVGEITRLVLVSGGDLYYGGHLDSDGYTSFIINELHRFSRRDKPFHSVLAWQEHRKLSLSSLEEKAREMGLYGEIIALDVEGKEINPLADRPNEAVMEMDQEIVTKSLTSMRRFMAENANARIFLGGKRAGFHGKMPGLIEEVLMALENKQPIFLAGGFGGVTADIASVLGSPFDDWNLPARKDMELDERLYESFANLKKFGLSFNDGSLKNGLTLNENLTLAITYRPSEIANLVSLGLGRLNAN